MSRLQLIEQKILSLDSAGFQNLCDVYLFRKTEQFTSINRTGSQLGKQKTTKGTPDTFQRLSDGSLRYVEFTTQENKLDDKIKADIDSCLNPAKSGIAQPEISKIIICFNSRLKPNEEAVVHQYAREKSIQIELIGIDSLALDIYSKYLIIAKDILGIPLDTGQLIPLDTFIKEYNNKGGQLSTPLDNLFLHRSSELQSIKDDFLKNDILVITGSPGVGKTKIALHAIDSFLADNTGHIGFAVAKKDVDIWEDLRLHLDQDKDYILLLDDANRYMPNFRQILGVYREIRKGKLKLVITVRDYAFADVKLECQNYAFETIEIEKFKDEEIVDIIKSDSFEIRNTDYQNKIVVLADGNARLAVMAAKLAREKNEEFLYGDISNLYDEYFQTFIKDVSLFSSPAVLKTLGIISFFFSINIEDKDFMHGITNNFGIDYYSLNEAIHDLEKRELIEVQYGYARVSEQITATYFFYKVFIQEKLLSFEILLLNYFSKWKWRIYDTIIPANNSFGYSNVLDRINIILDKFYQSLNDEGQILEFFSLFWFYKKEETLAYFYQKVNVLPEPIQPEYNSYYETNAHVFSEDKYLEHLTKFFDYYTESYFLSLELTLEYSRKTPDALPELTRRIREKILFNHDDDPDYCRQIELFSLLKAKIANKHKVAEQIFLALVPIFLGHSFQISRGVRRNTLSFYQYNVPESEVILTLRTAIWNQLFEIHQYRPDLAFVTLQAIGPDIHGTNAALLEHDLSLLLPFITSAFKTTEFEHIHYVHNLVKKLDNEELEDRSYRELTNKFTNEEYANYQILEWNYLHEKEEYEYDNHREYYELKAQDLRNRFVFNSKEDYSSFVNTINIIARIKDNNEWNVQQSSDIVIESTFNRNPLIGFELFKEVLFDYPFKNFTIYKTLKAIIRHSDKYAEQVWTFLSTWNNENKLHWQLVVFNCLHDHLYNELYLSRLLETINSIDRYIDLRFEDYKKFLPIKPSLIVDIVQIITDKVEDKNLRITVWYDFYPNYFHYFKDNFSLIEKLYLQQEAFNRKHDYKNDGLKILIGHSQSFLSAYINEFYTKGDSYNIDTHDDLSFVWDIVNVSQIESVINEVIVNHRFLGIREHPIIVFFNHLKEGQVAKAKTFLLEYIAKHNTDSRKINAIFDVIRRRLSGQFEQFFLFYLTHNSDLEYFKNISWEGSSGVLSGKVNRGDLNASKWQKIFDILMKHPNQLELIPISAYVKKRIAWEIESGERERMRDFIMPER